MPAFAASHGAQQARHCIHCFCVADAAGASTRSPAAQGDGTCGRIHISTFGGLRAWGPAGPITLSARHRHLLRWLVLASWGPPLSVAAVCDALWPLVDGAAAASNFASTVRRLRLVLGNRAAIVVEGGGVGLDPVHCSTDLGLLRRLLTLQPQEPCMTAGGEQATHWTRCLLDTTEGDNPLLMAVSSGGDMVQRIEAVVAAWRQVTLQLTALPDAPAKAGALDSAGLTLALRLCERIERHGWADDRVRARWHALSAACGPVMARPSEAP